MGITANVKNEQIVASVGETKIDVSVGGGVGPTGSAGAAATVSVGTVTTGAAGSSATVTNVGTPSAAVLNFTIPQGAAGSVGPAGAAGATGAAGAAATVSVGTVTTGAAGSSASVTNVGTSSAAVFNFTIPAGATGATGPQGATGPAGTTTWAGITDKPSTFTPAAHTHTFSDSSTTSTYTNFLTTVGGGTLADALGGIDSALGDRALASDFDQGVKTTDQVQFARIDLTGDLYGPFIGIASGAVQLNEFGVALGQGGITFADQSVQTSAFDGAYTSLTSVPSTFTPSAHKTSHATGGSDALSPSDIGAAAVSHAHSATADLTFAGATAGQVLTVNSGATALVWATPTTYSLPDATNSVKGGITVSTGLSVASGALSVSYGTTSGTACQGNDARLSDARTPTGNAGGDLTGTYPNPTIAAGAVTEADLANAVRNQLIHPFLLAGM